MDQFAPDPPAEGGVQEADGERRLRCHFCGTTATWDEAVDGGWVPDFYLPDGTCSTDPACPDCTARHLRRDADGEHVLR